MPVPEYLSSGPRPPLVTAAEARDLLGVTKQRLHQFMQFPDFPNPAVEHGRVRLWWKADIEAFADYYASGRRYARQP